MRRAGKLLAPSIVLTGNQTAGRGRGANVWHSGRGTITATIVLPAHDSLPPEHVPLVAGLAVRNAVARFGIESAKIKWPNDIWVEDRKLAGLLCERIDRVDLIGVGLNVNAKWLPRGLESKAISMSQCIAQPLDINEVLIVLSANLRELLSDARTSLAGVLPQIRAVDALVGRRIRVTDADRVLEGLYEGIDPRGRLRLNVSGQTRSLFSGSITLAAPQNR